MRRTAGVKNTTWATSTFASNRYLRLLAELDGLGDGTVERIDALKELTIDTPHG